jgi:hypothetical protein
MSTYSLNTYLVDENNDFVLTESGDKIVIDTISIDVDYGAAIAGMQSRSRPVLTFEVKKDEASDSWHVTTNRQTFIGRYPSRDVALGALFGVYVRWGGHPDGFVSFLEEALSSRGAVIDDDVEFEYLYGNASILSDFYEGKAHVNFIGDSISNDSNTDFRTTTQGAIQYFKPVKWDAINAMESYVASTQGTQALNVSAGLEASDMDLAPGEPETNLGGTDLVGFGPHRESHFQQLVGSSNHGFYTQYRFDEGGGATDYDIYTNASLYSNAGYRNADGSKAIYDGDEVTFRFLVNSRHDGVADSTTGDSYMTEFRSWIFSPSGVESVYSADVDLATDFSSYGSGLHTYPIDQTVTFDAAWHNNDWIQQRIKPSSTDVTWPAGSNGDGLIWGSAGGFIKIADDGFRVAYTGMGGWTTNMHVYEFPNVPAIDQPSGGTTNGTGYTDLGLSEWLRAMDITHFVIHLGQNQSAGNVWANGAATATQIQSVVQRYRDACADVGISDPKFVILGIAPGTDVQSRIAQQRICWDNLKAWAPTQTDVVFIDTLDWLETNQNMDFSVADLENGPWLGVNTIAPNPGDTFNVHWNEDGQELIMNQLFWGKVIEVKDSEDPDPPSSVYDIVRFLEVPHQVTTNSTYTVQFIAEVVDPSATAPTPTVEGVTATAVNLTYPDKGTTSTTVWQATIPLDMGVNRIQVDGTDQTFTITRKMFSSSVNVTNHTELVAALEAAVLNTTTDEIIVDYVISDIRAATSTINLQKSAVDASPRESFFTLRPGTGSIGWDRSSLGIWRPTMNYLCIEGASIGSASADQLGGQFYLENDYKFWLKDCDEVYQYDYSYTSDGGTRTGTDARLPAGVLVPTVKNPGNSDTEIYWTGGTIKGDASLRASWKIVKDIVFEECRSDMCSNTTVMANIYVKGCTKIRTNADTDWTHLDLLQYWGDGTHPNGSNMDVENIVAVGCLVENVGSLPTEVQTWLFDRTYGATRTNLLIRDVTTESQDASNNFCQFAGDLTNVRIENISLATNGFFSYRADFNGTDASGTPEKPFNPSNMYMKDTSSDRHLFQFISDPSVSLQYGDVSDTSDITTELNQTVSDHSVLSGLEFISPHEITAAPVEGNFGTYGSGNPRYRTDNGTANFVNTLGFTGGTRYRVYDDSSGFGVFLDFDTSTNRDAAQAANLGKTFTLVVTPTDGTNGNAPFTYEWAYGAGSGFNLFSGSTGNLPLADVTSGAANWPASGVNTWGDTATYSLTVN